MVSFAAKLVKDTFSGQCKIHWYAYFLRPRSANEVGGILWGEQSPFGTCVVTYTPQVEWDSCSDTPYESKHFMGRRPKHESPPLVIVGSGNYEDSKAWARGGVDPKDERVLVVKDPWKSFTLNELLMVVQGYADVDEVRIYSRKPMDEWWAYSRLDWEALKYGVTEVNHHYREHAKVHVNYKSRGKVDAWDQYKLEYFFGDWNSRHGYGKWVYDAPLDWIVPMEDVD